MDAVSATEPSQLLAGLTSSHHVWDGVGGHGSIEGQPPLPHPMAARPDPVPHHWAAVALGALEQLLAECGEVLSSLLTVKG